MFKDFPGPSPSDSRCCNDFQGTQSVYTENPQAVQKLRDNTEKKGLSVSTLLSCSVLHS